MASGRFAPSPTGRLHLGSARTALMAWLAARFSGSPFRLRMEDLDRPRVVPDAAEAILEDLRWLGLDWDGPVVYQSQRLAGYEAAVRHLEQAGLVFGCCCSRADVARAASAPHAGEEGPRYPGTCRFSAPTGNRQPSLRFTVDPGHVCFDDQLAGVYCQDVSDEIGDFILRRADGIFAYQLAVVVDDIAMGIEEIVRGADLLSSTPRQLLLYRAFGATPPRYAHVPLILGPDGQRLAKRHGGVAVRALREDGWTAPRLVGRLAWTLGLCETDAEFEPRDLIDRFSWPRIRQHPATLEEVRGP